MAQPQGDARTDQGKAAGADAPANPLYLQIADDLPQQSRSFNKNASSTATLPAISLFEKERHDITVADTTEPTHDFMKERQLLFKGTSTMKCHQGNSGQDSRPFDNNYRDLEKNFFQKGGDRRLLEDTLKPGTALKTDLSDEQYKQLVEWIKDPSKKEAKPGQDGNKVLPLPEVKVEPKTEPPKETANSQEQEKRVEEKKVDEKSTEVPKVEEIPLTAFERTIKNTGAYTVENISEAYNAAGKDKTGVALVIVGENTPGSKELLEKLPQLQAQHPDLKFVVVNKDKLDERLAKNPADNQAKNWKAWVDQNLKDCDGQPINYSFTSVQTLKADANGKPVPEKVTSTHWGANLEESLADQSRFAAAGTARNAGDFKLESKPEAEAVAFIEEQPKTNGCHKIERSVSSTFSGEARACNAAKQSNCQSFCQSPREGNWQRRPLLNLLRRRH